MKVVHDLMAVFPVEIPALSDTEYVTRARQILRDYVFREVYVRDAHNALVGYIDITDVLRVTNTKSNITVSGYVKEAPVVAPDGMLEDAARTIARAGTGSAAVVGDGRTLKGAIWLSKIFPVLVTRHELRGSVEDCMSRDVVSCNSDDSLQKIYSRIVESTFDALPVMKKGSLVGIISRSDLLRKGTLRRAINNAHTDMNVESVMTTPALTIAPDDGIAAAAQLLVRHDISRVPVIAGGEVVGILDRHDVLKGLKIQEG
ncbi:MAG TPA: CBS domain-containing protein [Methanoculleus sp.]|nr:CBS domain-containing protein [Methanoculleus sp.]